MSRPERTPEPVRRPTRRALQISDSACHSSFRDRLRYNENVIAVGGQTERRGDPRPVRACLQVRTSPAVLAYGRGHQPDQQPPPPALTLVLTFSLLAFAFGLFFDFVVVFAWFMINSW